MIVERFLNDFDTIVKRLLKDNTRFLNDC